MWRPLTLPSMPQNWLGLGSTVGEQLSQRGNEQEGVGSPRLL